MYTNSPLILSVYLKLHLLNKSSILDLGSRINTYYHETLLEIWRSTRNEIPAPVSEFGYWFSWILAWNDISILLANIYHHHESKVTTNIQKLLSKHHSEPYDNCTEEPDCWPATSLVVITKIYPTRKTADSRSFGYDFIVRTKRTNHVEEGNLNIPPAA